MKTEPVQQCQRKVSAGRSPSGAGYVIEDKVIIKRILALPVPLEVVAQVAATVFQFFHKFFRLM